MRQKPFAILSDVVLVLVLVAGVAGLLLSGAAPQAWTDDKILLPLSVDGSRLILLTGAVAVVLGLALAFVLRVAPDRWLNGDVIRYSAFERLSHWATVLGYLLAFGSAVVMLRWLSLTATIAERPFIYQVHFAGAALIVLAALTFVAKARAQGQDALFPRWRDVPAAVARLFGYLGIYGESGVLGLRWPKGWQAPCQGALAAVGIRPAASEDKFLSVEKVLSCTPLAVLTLLVVGTGLVKAARYFFNVPPDVVYWSTWLHDWATPLTVVVVGAHLAAIFLVPRNWPGIRAMVTGRMSREAVAHEFPAWAARLGPAKPKPAPAEVAPAAPLAPR